MRFNVRVPVTMVFFSALAACGGGGGGSSGSAAVTPVTPASITCPDGSTQATTAMCALPLLTSVTPASGTAGVNLDAPGTFLIDVETNSAINTPASVDVTFKVGLTPYAGTISLKGTKGFTYTPSVKLLYGQTYDFTATVKDTLGRSLLVTSSFTTASISCVAPNVPNAAGNLCVSSTVVNGNLLMVAPVSIYTPGSPEDRNFNELNRLRINGGFGAAVSDPVMTKAAQNHVVYEIAVGADAHIEVVGNTGFTGVLPSDRCIAAAIGTSEQGLVACGEDTTSGGGTPDVLDVLGGFSVATGHLQNALDYRNNANGFAITGYSAQIFMNGVLNQTIPSSMTTLDLGNVMPNIASLGSAKQSSPVGVYPFDGMTNAGVGTWQGSQGSTTLGYPLSILIQMPVINGALVNPVVTSFTLRKEGDTTDTPSVIWPAGSMHGTEDTLAGWGILFPSVILAVNSKYTVTFIGTFNGSPITKVWSFTTGTSALTVMGG